MRKGQSINQSINESVLFKVQNHHTQWSQYTLQLKNYMEQNIQQASKLNNNILNKTIILKTSGMLKGDRPD